MNKRQIKKIVSNTRKPMPGRYYEVEQILRTYTTTRGDPFNPIDDLQENAPILHALGLELLAEIKRLHIDMYMFTSMFKLTKEEEE